MNATDFAKHVRSNLKGLPNEPKIQPKGQDHVRFQFPNGIRIDVWPGKEEELSFEVFIREFPKKTERSVSLFTMTPDDSHVGEASVDGMAGRLIEAASHTNPAGLLRPEDRDALAQTARDKIQQDEVDLIRWEKLSLAYKLTNNILP